MDVLVVGGLVVAAIAMTALAVAVYSTNKAIERDLDRLRQRVDLLRQRVDVLAANPAVVSEWIPVPPGSEVRVRPGGGGGGPTPSDKGLEPETHTRKPRVAKRRRSSEPTSGADLADGIRNIGFQAAHN